MDGCNFCGSHVQRFAGRVVYHQMDDRSHLVNLYKCKTCKSLIMDVDKNEIENHIEAAWYVKPQSRDRYWYRRELFFNCILDEIELVVQRSQYPTILDVGCSYGHLLYLANKRGYSTYGVEVSNISEDCSHSVIFKNIEDIRNMYFDVVTMIDSLYYCDNPHAMIVNVVRLLKPNGLLIVRNTNRSWMYTLAKMFGMHTTFLGDAIYSFDHRSFVNYVTTHYPLRIVKQLAGCERSKRVIKGDPFSARSLITRLLKVLDINLGLPIVLVKVE